MLLASFRTIDGFGNNALPARDDWGAADTNIIRHLYPADYPDGYGDQIYDAATNSPNPRDVSNALGAQTGSVLNDRNLSDWVVQWGQFLTHDLDLTGNDAANDELFAGGTGDFSIPITNPNDPFGDGIGNTSLTFHRSNYDPETGDTDRLPAPGPPGATRPDWREQINEVTSFIDASNVYGSDQARANALRTFSGGRLKTTEDGLLPGYNDAGEENDNPFGQPANALFLAGDIRANEQTGLTSTHALFVREHNRLADLIQAADPRLNDEQIYQWARKIVGAEMQIVTYTEFLPALMRNTALDPYSYLFDPNVNPAITSSFSTAFFRFGHSMQSPELLLVNNDGTWSGSLSFAEMFGNPGLLTNDPSIVDRMLKGLASQVAQEVDVLMVDELRNLPFGAPFTGAGGLDLISLDIQRGRDHGLLSYNAFRDSYRLGPYNSINQITASPELRGQLQSVYGNVNRIDAFIGALAEDHLPNQSLGPLLNFSLTDQFSRLRDGDRFFYTGDPDLQSPLVSSVIDLEGVTLAEIIRNNSGITNLQDNVFFAEPTVNSVVDRHLFYDNSGFDTQEDDAAIATDKHALLPGEASGFENYSSHSRGINGMMIDVQGMSAAPTSADFEFRVGNDNDPANWPLAATPTITSHDMDGDIKRIALTWLDGAVRNTWLQVTVRATENTGLLVPDVFYFGNAVGEAGDSVDNALVNGFDFASTREHLVASSPGAAIDNKVDFNRDAVVDGADLAITRDNTTDFANSLRRITVPAPVPPIANLVLSHSPDTPPEDDEPEMTIEFPRAAAVDAVMRELSNVNNGRARSRPLQPHHRLPVGGPAPGPIIDDLCSSLSNPTARFA